MKFYIYDFEDWCGSLYLTSEDYEHDCLVDVWDCYDEDREEWNDEEVRSAAEEQLKARYGTDAVLVWEGR